MEINWILIDLANEARDLMIKSPKEADIIFYNFMLSALGIDINVKKSD